MNIAKSEKGQQDLEPNHTHFLLLDDGTYSGYDIGDYRTRFVQDVSRFNKADGTARHAALSVHLCVSFSGSFHRHRGRRRRSRYVGHHLQ